MVGEKLLTILLNKKNSTIRIQNYQQTDSFRWTLIYILVITFFEFSLKCVKNEIIGASKSVVGV